MKFAYKIEVSVSAKSENNLQKPYYWILWSNTGNDWCNDCCGWAATPEIAWNDALDFYRSFKAPTPVTE